MTATALDMLRADHRNLWQLLNILEAQINEFKEGKSPDYEVIQCILDYCLDYPAEVHHPREDLIYDRLKAKDKTATAEIMDLRADHEDLAARTRGVANAVDLVLQEAAYSREWIGTATRNFLDAYRQHIRREENEIFPLAERNLDDADWQAIEQRFTDAKDPLNNLNTEQRFEILRKYIVDFNALGKPGEPITVAETQPTC